MASSGVQQLPSALELGPLALAAGFAHLSRPATEAARSCLDNWVHDILSAAVHIMQTEYRSVMRLSDVHDGIRACVSRLTTPLAEVYGSSSQKIRVKNGAYHFDESAEPDYSDSNEALDDDDAQSDSDSEYADENESDDEVASQDLICEEELTESDDEGDDHHDEHLELTPSSGVESTPPENRDQIERMEAVAADAAADDVAYEAFHYKPSIHPDTINRLIRNVLNNYRVDIRISVELQCFIHLWLEERLMESFRMDQDCEIMLMTAIHNGKRLPLGMINQLSKPAEPRAPAPAPAPSPSPSRAAAAAPSNTTGKKRTQALLTSYSSGSEGRRLKDTELSPIHASSSSNKLKRPRPSDVTQAAEHSFMSNAELDDTFDEQHGQAGPSLQGGLLPAEIGLQLGKFRQSTDQLYNLLAEYNSKEPVGPLKKRIADLEVELSEMRQKYAEAQASLNVVARHAQGILAFCDLDTNK